MDWELAIEKNQGSVTVDLNKDNYQFGVRAVGKNGFKSPAVWPLPAVTMYVSLRSRPRQPQGWSLWRPSTITFTRDSDGG